MKCPHNAVAGGCALHNLQCAWPHCETEPSQLIGSVTIELLDEGAQVVDDKPALLPEPPVASGDLQYWKRRALTAEAEQQKLVSRILKIRRAVDDES